MIVKHKLKGMATKKNEIFGKFRRGGFSSKIPFIDYLNETIRIRLDNGQNILLVSIIFLLIIFIISYYEFYKLIVLIKKLSIR